MRPAKHSPRPWHRNIRPARKFSVVFSGRNTHVAQVIPNGLDDEEVEANMDLIYSAPDILHALQLCRDQFALYAQNHLAKSPPDLAKAATNNEFVAMCDGAISKAIRERA